MIALLAVPPALTPKAWDKARPYICAAIDRTEFLDSKAVQADVYQGKAILWLAADGTEVIGAGITQKFHQAGKHVCEIIAWGAKDQARCAPLLRTIEAFAIAEGCTCVRLVGRKGWARHLTDYSVKALIMEKAL
jgi:hypothetical protein